MSNLNPHPDILCFRAYDMRDHFPEPVETFRQALELLQSDRAYLPEESASIICYLKTGQSIAIPDSLYLKNVPRFENEAAAREWVFERDRDIKEDKASLLCGMIIADPKLPIDAQVVQAMAWSDTEVIDASENNRVCEHVDTWLKAAIEALPKQCGSEVKSRDFKRL